MRIYTCSFLICGVTLTTCPPKFFEKNLTLTVYMMDKGTMDTGNISFALNLNTAMGYIDGSVMNILELAEAKLSGEERLGYFSPGSVDLAGHRRNFNWKCPK